MVVALIADERLASQMWDHSCMSATSDDERLEGVRRANLALKRAEATVAKRRAELGEAIAQALNEGARPRDILEIEGLKYSREHLRRIAREHDVAPLKPPTVQRIPRAQDPEQD